MSNNPHPDDTWISKYGVEVRVLSLPKNTDGLF